MRGEREFGREEVDSLPSSANPALAFRAARLICALLFPRALHGPHPHHLGTALHQRRQTPGQPRGLHAAGGCLCALRAGAGERDPLHLRHGRARHPGRAGRRRRGPGHPDLLRGMASQPARPRPRLRPQLGLVRPLVLAAEPRPDAALRRGAGGQRPDRGAPRPDGLFDRRQALPARPLHRGHLPTAASARPGAISATTAATCSILST